MHGYLSEEGKWAEAVAARLRLLQVGAFSETDQRRKQFLTEELQAAIQEVPDARRKDYLRELSDRFPAWEAAAAAPAAPPRTPAPDTPQSVLAAIGRLSAEQRAELVAELRSQGVVPADRQAPTSVDLPRDLQRKLVAMAERDLNLDRAVALMVVLADAFLNLERTVWRTWERVNPKSNVRREAVNTGDARLTINRFLKGDAACGTEQLSDCVNLRIGLSAALLAAVGGASGSFSRRYIERLAPENIEDAVAMQKSGWGNKKALCWDKYLELAQTYLSQEAMEKEIRDVLAELSNEFLNLRTSNPAG